MSLELRTVFKTFDFVNDNDDNWNGNKRKDCWVFKKKVVKNHKNLINMYLSKIAKRKIGLNYIDENTIDLALITLNRLNPSLVKVSFTNIIDIFSSSKNLRNLIYQKKVRLNDEELVIYSKEEEEESKIFQVIKQYPLSITELNPYKLLYVIYKINGCKIDFNSWLENSLGRKWKISYEHLLVLTDKNNWISQNNLIKMVNKRKRKRKKKTLLTTLAEDEVLFYLNDWKTKGEIMKELESNNYDTNKLSSRLGSLLFILYKNKKKIIRKGKRKNYKYKKCTNIVE
jgi:hypothetical protein